MPLCRWSREDTFRKQKVQNSTPRGTILIVCKIVLLHVCNTCNAVRGRNSHWEKKESQNGSSMRAIFRPYLSSPWSPVLAPIPCNYFSKSQKSIFQQFVRFLCTVSSRISVRGTVLVRLTFRHRHSEKGAVHILGEICPRSDPDISHMRDYLEPLKLHYIVCNDLYLYHIKGYGIWNHFNFPMLNPHRETCKYGPHL